MSWRRRWEGAGARSMRWCRGQPDGIAGVVSSLTGPDSGWVNGQVLNANGGRT